VYSQERVAPDMSLRSSGLGMHDSLSSPAVLGGTLERVRSGDHSGGRPADESAGEASGSETSKVTDSSDASEADGEAGTDSSAAGSVISPPHAPPQRSAYICAPTVRLGTGSMWKYFSPVIAARASPLMF
jgi:hypothetical protein